MYVAFRLFSLFRFLLPPPLKRFERTLISSFFVPLLGLGDPVPSPLIGDGVSGLSARLIPDGPIGEPRNPRGTEHLSYGAWIFELAGLPFQRKPDDEWGGQPHSPSGLIASECQRAQLFA